MRLQDRVLNIARAIRGVLLTALVLNTAGDCVSAEQPPKAARESTGNADSQDNPGPAVEVDPEHAAKMRRGLDLFQRHVRAVLVNQCLRCHGGDAVESGFNLATREGLLKGGDYGTAVVPGDARASRLYRVITHAEEPTMPMDASKLGDEQIDHIREWIDNLAPYDDPLVDPGAAAQDWTQRTVAPEAREFWSFRPLQGVASPQVTDPDWCRTPVDRFIARELESHELAPNPPADRRTLIRRAHLDLIGLPPAPEAVDAFVADDRPDAYERLIDRLLDSPHYGERWGRHWLDLARFAESHGFEHDYDRPSAYHYRDFVIEALNQDMPFDRFTRWQLAGDELAPGNRLALMATGFLAAGVHSTQITINEAERHRYDEMDDMLATTGTAFLGLTIGCARCHDHKFDPIPQADYYRMLSTFTTAIRSEIEVNFDPEGYAREKAAWDEEHRPLLAARSEYEAGPLKAGFEEWQANVGDSLRESPSPRGAGTRESASPSPGPSLEELPRWVVLDLTRFKSPRGTTFEKLPDGSLLAGGENPLHDVYTFEAVLDPPGITAVRLEALAHRSLERRGPGRAGNGNFALSDFTVTAQPVDSDDPPQEIEFTQALATFSQTAPRLPVEAAVDEDPLSAWAVDPQIGRDHAAAFALATPLEMEGPVRLTFTLRFTHNSRHGIGRPRLSVTSAPGPLTLEGESIAQRVIAALRAPPDQRSQEQTEALFAWFRQRDEHWQTLNDAVRRHERAQPQPPVKKVLITSEGLPPLKLHTQAPREFMDETYYLQRGDVNQKVRVARQGFLQVVMTADEDALKQALKTQPSAHNAQPPTFNPQRSTPQPSTLQPSTLNAQRLNASTLNSRPANWSPPADWQPSGRRAELARWMTDVEQGAGHLLARVIVNRLWQHHLGQGIVATPSDFGAQGEPPTHPELLDWLAGELIRHEWRLKPIHRLIMSSAVYRQSSSIDPHKQALDPDNRWCWRRPRMRLEAEAIRDSLLAVSGRLDRAMHGPSTLDETMTRRSIYFTVKRSHLVPAMVVFDAPDALGGIARRPSTTVAPQALYLMNNEQVRACALALAAEVLDPEQPPAEWIRRAWRRALGREPSALEREQSLVFMKSERERRRSAGAANPQHLALADFCQVLLGLNEFVYAE